MSISKPYPAGSLPDLTEEFVPLLLSGIFQALMFAGIVDKYGQKHHRCFQEEVQRRLEVKDDNGHDGDDHSGDLRSQNVEHVVSELQDEGHGQPQEGSDKNECYGEHIVAIKEATVLYLPIILRAQAQHQPIEQHPEDVQLAILHKDTFIELVPFLQDLFIIDVGQSRDETLHYYQQMAQAEAERFQCSCSGSSDIPLEAGKEPGYRTVVSSRALFLWPGVLKAVIR